MIRRILGLLMFAALGAALSAGFLALAFARGADLTLEMDRELPAVVAQGFHRPERHGQVSFAWTTERADLRLAGLDRRRPWSCELRFRGARPDPSTLPIVVIAVDAATAATVAATNDFADIGIDVPARPGRTGLALTIVSSNSFVPGPGDKRMLGIQVDRLHCAPVSGGARPPRGVLLHGAAGGAAFGGAVALAGLPMLAGAGVTAVVAGGQALLLSSGLAPYGQYPSRLLRVGLWVAGLAVALVWGLRKLRSTPLPAGAATVVLFSAAVLHLKILGLLHPAKSLIDALFHAHRLEWVLSGRYFFTQGMPGGVSFPYAIGLYVFSAPWTMLTRDYVTLLRIVVSTAEVAAGALLYVLVVKTWRDSLAGVLAVVLYNCVRLPYVVVGNANMTNAFGQAVALAAVVAVALCPPRGGGSVFWAGAFALTALAFLSHISTFSLLAMTLVTLGLLYWWRGGEELWQPGRLAVGVTVAAALLAVLVYYGHFMDVYRTAWRARTQAPVASPAPSPPAKAPTDGAAREPGTPMPVRAANAFKSTAVEIGWPILLLAAVGGWRLWVRGARTRLAFVVMALALTYGTFLLASTLSRVDAPFERYAFEFVGRVVLATFPAAVILGAIGAAWAWRAGTVARVASVLCLLAAISGGVRHWESWFR
jgi:hypothetical protein